MCEKTWWKNVVEVEYLLLRSFKNVRRVILDVVEGFMWHIISKLVDLQLGSEFMSTNQNFVSPC